MVAEQSAQDGGATTRVGDHSRADAPRRTPDESTAALASSATGPAVSASEGDVPPLQPGETLVGRFTVVRFIAQGGMGAVYEANDSVLRSRVALKLIRRRIAQDSTAMERFRREVLLARQVSHPNVCRVYELYEATTASGEPIQFLTMELLLGETLSRRLAREGALRTPDALPLVQQMCAGLAAAHAEGVIHRDFKSSNIMLVPRADASGEPSTQATRVAITDFGVARALAAPEGEDRLTGEAGVLGTPEYMAPEQVTGSEVTPSTDIYALGVVLYEMVTGKLPFVGDNPLAAAARRLNEAAPRPELLAPGLDARWANAIVRCMAREPRRRFHDALDVVEAVRGRPWRWRRPLVLSGLACLSLLLGAFAAVWAVPRMQRGWTRPAMTAPRPVAAILGFANGLPGKALRWLPTAVEEGLHHELAAAETSLRLLPTDRVADARRSLGVTEDVLLEVKSRSRLQGLLVANTLIHGDIAPLEAGSDRVQVRLHVLDGPTGRELGAFSEELGPGAAKLPEALVNLGSRLREALHAPLSSEEEAALSATRVKSLDAAQAYAEGVSSLQTFDYAQARQFFNAALAHDASLVDAQRRVFESWQKQGFRKKAREAAERLASQKHLLTSRQAEEVAARVVFLGPPDYQKRIEARLALLNTRPDDGELGFEAAFGAAAPKTRLALVRRLRQLPRPLSEDLRLDVAEAIAVWGDDPKHANELFDRAERRGRELGARSEQALVHGMRATFFQQVPGGVLSEALAHDREALRLHSEAGNLEAVARTKEHLASLLAANSPGREAVAALDEAAGAYRRLGNRWRLQDLLAQSAVLRWQIGDAELGKKLLEEAHSEAELLGEPPGDSYLWVKARYLCADADPGCKSAMQEWRGRWGADNQAVLMVEAALLREQDHLEEARVQWKRAARLAEQEGGEASLSALALSNACAVECDQGSPAEGLACLAALNSKGEKESGGLAEARCKNLSKDFSGAETAARAVLVDLPAGEFVFRAQSSIELARAMAGRGETAKAISDLRRTLREIESKRLYKRLAFQAALALGEAELGAGSPAGRPRLVRLEQEAKEREVFRIARLAREALDRNQPVNTGSSVAR